jgi:hypothetical protein
MSVVAASRLRTTDLSITSYQGVEAKIARVHGDRLVWRKQLLGQRETNFDAVS